MRVSLTEYHFSSCMEPATIKLIYIKVYFWVRTVKLKFKHESNFFKNKKNSCSGKMSLYLQILVLGNFSNILCDQQT